MKYAFLLGSNVYIVPNNTISFTDHEQTNQFLRILSVHEDTPPDQPRKILRVDADIKDVEGHVIHLSGNKPEGPGDFDVLEQVDRVVISNPDGTAILDVLQLDTDAAMALEHNIVAELEVNDPVAVIRLRGNFLLGNLHIEIDNEKLFIGDDSYANSTLAGANDLKFSDSGVNL